MSTTFGILKETLPIEVGDENGVFSYINKDVFEKVWFRGNTQINEKVGRWINELAYWLPDDTRVYALDNSQQGVYTIGDIKQLMR